MWELDGNQVHLKHGAWTAKYSTLHPELGLAIYCLSCPTTTASLCQITPGRGGAKSPTDAYIRQSDLIVDYSEQSQDEFSYQTYFRLLHTNEPNVLGLEVWLSVQTNLLDSSPEINFGCQISGHSWNQIATHQKSAAELPWVTSGNASTVVVMVHPLDSAQTKVASAPQAESNSDQLKLKLFSHFMEKGVIRRARLRIYLCCKARIPESWIMNAYQEFSESELPLTT